MSWNEYMHKGVQNLSDKPPTSEYMFICGIDYSPTHFAIVTRNPKGNVSGVIAASTVKKHAEYTKDGTLTAFWMIPGKPKDKEFKEVYNMGLMANALRFFDSVVPRFMDLSSSVWGLEDYAFGAKSSSVHMIAELTGHLKQVLVQRGARVRTIDPRSVKMWASKGNATKREMRHAADNEGFALADGLFTGLNSDDIGGLGTDIVDAFFLSQIAWAETRIRFGMDPALTERQIEIFNRATPTMPVNILSRPYICTPVMVDLGYLGSGEAK